MEWEYRGKDNEVLVALEDGVVLAKIALIRQEGIITGIEGMVSYGTLPDNEPRNSLLNAALSPNDLEALAMYAWTRFREGCYIASNRNAGALRRLRRDEKGSDEWLRGLNELKESLGPEEFKRRLTEAGRAYERKYAEHFANLRAYLKGFG